ncbi:MAG TPA: carboxypeptidase regulatory-like domain-containing protein [Candidatus Polarisedimenticolia bacterium]|nr:carboxypeptidase regulatory-like domain-containing protein [Candidatus Polarisedimenticolia bacterium]
MIRHFARICALLLTGFAATFALGQNSNTGEIKGTAQDSTGALLEGVKVRITNVQTGLSIVSVTNSAGIYDVPSVPTGEYTITFSKAGFKELVRRGLTLEIQTIAVDGTLQVGSLSEQVVVTAETPLVETETSDQRVDLNTAAIRSAPIVGTDWRAEMIQLIPGVNTGGGAGEANGQAAGVNGTQSYNIMFLSDGGPATAPRDFNGSNYYMPVDAIGEVSVNSANAPPQYGGGLTSVNVITKSGTNQWHGSGYEYIQNTAFNSRNFFDPAPNVKSVEHWNTYGGSIGGPIIKNKLFFFFLYQRNPSSSPTSGLYTYPTAAMAAGDFYGVSGYNANPAFFNPTTGGLLAPIDPVASKLQSYFPAATAKGWLAGCPGPVNVSASTPQTCPTINNFVFNGSSPNTDTWYTGRVDYDLSSKQRLSFSFNYFPTTTSYVPADPLFPNDATAYEQGKTDNLTGQVSDVYTISPTVLNEFRVAASRELDKYVPPSFGKNDPATLGLEPAYGTNSPANVFPHVGIDEGAGVGMMNLGAGICSTCNGNIDATLGEGIYAVSDVLTLIRGKHTIKVGGEYDRLYQNYTSWGDVDSGHFEFNGSVSGIPYADFLSGNVYGWFVSESDPTSAHTKGGALFASDDFKVSQHLTLNLGLRWQMQSGWAVSNNLFGNYDPVIPDPTQFNGAYPGGILFGGQSDKAFGGTIGRLSAIQNGDYKEFAPRVGFAWSPGDKWVVRGSFGIFDAPRDAENYTDGALGLGFNPHNQGNGGYTNGSAAFPLSSGPPAGTVIFPTVQTLSSTLANYSSAEYYPRNMPTVYVEQFLLGVQRDLGRGLMLDTSYVYTRGRNLNFATDINQATTPGSTAVGGFECTSFYHCGNPNPVFNSISAQYYDGYSNYNALQLRLVKRMSYGLSFQVNYAWSKSLDTGTGNGHGSGIDIYQNAYTPSANYGLSDFNSANTLVGQITYEVPFGHGRQFALHGPLDQIAGGWRVSSLFQWHGGVPFTPVIQSSVAGGIDPGLTAAFNAGSTLYPEQVGDPSVSSRSHAMWFNPAAFANPADGTFGNAHRNTLVGPSFANVNLSVAKEFPLHEQIALEIRADMFDVFNHINWANPDANVGYSSGLLADSTAGQVTTPINSGIDARIIQLGAHVRF